MTGGDSIRGVRIGGGPAAETGPAGETERGESAPRQRVNYWCANGHHTQPSFAIDVEAPQRWDCPRCGLLAGQDPTNPPESPRTEPYKSHLAYVKERRSDSDGAALLEEALTRLKERKGR